MNKSPKSHAEALDDQLADFADQVLAGENETSMDALPNQAELAELQKTILKMKTAVRAAHPSPETSARMRTRLLQAWEQEKQPVRPPSKRFTWPWPLPRFALVGGLAVLSILGLLVLLSAPAGTPLMGTADGSPILALLSIIVGLVIISVFLWLDHRD
jgi:hypothetical protein